MLFEGGHSALVRLTDSLKIALLDCANAEEQAFSEFKTQFKNGTPKTREEAMAVDLPRVSSALFCLNSRALSTIISASFVSESYINSFSFRYFNVRDERISTMDKWEKAGKWKGAPGFDKSRAPFQHLKYLFTFRNDLAHDKVVDYSADKSGKRYGGKFLDYSLGFYSLANALFAAQTYWEMVLELHRVTGIPKEEFHQHYNLSPWGSDESESQLKRSVARWSGA